MSTLKVVLVFLLIVANGSLVAFELGKDRSVLSRVFCYFLVFCFVVQALIAIKGSLEDPHNVLDNWDRDSVDPCSWAMITCSNQNFVTGL